MSVEIEQSINLQKQANVKTSAKTGAKTGIKSGAKEAARDVRAVKTALNKLGFYHPVKGRGVTGDIGPDFLKAVQNFQRAHFIPVRKSLVPGDITMERLNAELDNPVNFQLFKSKYIWRTVGDGNVRHTHSAREGRTFSWDTPPEGGHPGEDFGCRCWAEPIVPFTPKGLNNSQTDLFDKSIPLDAIESSASPLDFLGGGVALLQGGKIRIGQSTFDILKNIFKGNIKLTGAQTKNLVRFTKKVPANAKQSIEVVQSKRGNITFKATSPGKIFGSRAVYEKTVDAKGNTIKYIKTTYDSKGKIIHIKNKLK
ncbi:MAG: peptidoglycan-binding protein [Alphaproteobacteria bacterium]|nr:peptidoglycan-binding protein [Alphaproteobacteria bacterium]